jgi:hypothetical protein
MAVSLRFIPGGTIRWRELRFVVVGYAGMDAFVTAVRSATLTHKDKSKWSESIFSKTRSGTKSMLKVFRPNGLPYLGERSDETIACRAALGERFPKGEARHLAKGG